MTVSSLNKEHEMKTKSLTQSYKGVPITLITDSAMSRKTAKLFQLGSKQRGQTIWIPNKCLTDDCTLKRRTIKEQTLLDDVFIKAYKEGKFRKAEIAINPEYWSFGTERGWSINHYTEIDRKIPCINCQYGNHTFKDTIPEDCIRCSFLAERNESAVVLVPVWNDDETLNELRTELANIRIKIDHFKRNTDLFRTTNDLKKRYNEILSLIIGL